MKMPRLLICSKNVAAELQFRVVGSDFTPWLSGQLYTFLGVIHRGYIPVETVPGTGEYDAENNYIDPVYVVEPFTPLVGFGGGIGTEIFFFRHFPMPVEIEYSVDWRPLAGDLADQFFVNLRTQMGFRYRY